MIIEVCISIIKIKFNFEIFNRKLLKCDFP